MNLAVKLYSAVPVGEKPVGISDVWPAEVLELGESTQLPEPTSDWVLMTPASLEAHKAANYDEHHTWYIMWKSDQDKSKIFKLTGTSSTPVDIDFGLFGLHKEEIFTQGWLTTVNLYKNFDPETSSFSDLVVKDEYQYFTLELSEFVSHRIETVSWYMQDGSVGLVKSFTKFYSIEKTFKEILVRRTNCLAASKKVGLFLILGEFAPGVLNAEHFLSLCESSGTVRLYEQGITQPLKDFIDASAEPYLDATIKAALIGELA